MPNCSHIDRVPLRDGLLGEPPKSQGCQECLAIGAHWLHLRRCLTCGQVGCCEGSPNKHAKAHAQSPGHELVQSFEPGEDWVWCYGEGVGFHVPGADNSPSHG